jgi:hypothetical protein
MQVSISSIGETEYLSQNKYVYLLQHVTDRTCRDQHMAHKASGLCNLKTSI